MLDLIRGGEKEEEKKKSHSALQQSCMCWEKTDVLQTSPNRIPEVQA